MKKNQDLKNKNGFLITCVSCIVLLLTLCYFGINTSFKGTSAVTVTCGNKHYVQYGQNRWCCPNASDTIYKVGDKLYCVVSGISNALSLQLVAADNSDGVACTATTAAGYDETFRDFDAVCPENLGSTWTSVSRVVSFENNWTYTCSAPYTTCAAVATEPQEVVEVEKACYYNEKSNFYIWTSVTTGDALYKKAPSYDTETNCEYANYKVAQYWLDTAKTSFYKGGGCWIEPGSERFDGTCSLSDAVVAGIVNPTKSGYTFLGWDDSTSCSSPMAVKSTIKIRDDISYYACWKSNSGGVATGEDEVEKYTVKYDANGGSGAPSSQTKIHGTNLTLSTAKPTRSNYTFKSWNTAKDGSGTKYAPGATYSANAAVTLYAQWSYNGGGGGGTTEPDPEPTTKTFTATFNPNGGTLNGSSTKSCTTTGSSCTISGLPTATKSGHTFKGWSTSTSCTSVSTSSLTLNSHKTYYACYVKNSSGTGDDGGDDNVTENPKTGELAIALVWMIGIFAIGYSVWYFKKAKQN